MSEIETATERETEEEVRKRAAVACVHIAGRKCEWVSEVREPEKMLTASPAIENYSSTTAPHTKCRGWLCIHHHINNNDGNTSACKAAKVLK